MDRGDAFIILGLAVAVLLIVAVGPALIAYAIWTGLGPVGFWQAFATVVLILIVTGGYFMLVVMLIAIAASA